MEQLTIWTIYDKPKDYPHGFIARKFLASRDSLVPTQSIMICSNIEPIQQELEANGFAKVSRDFADQPSIVESWL